MCSHSLILEMERIGMIGMYGRKLHEGEEGVGWPDGDSRWLMSSGLGCGRSLFHLVPFALLISAEKSVRHGRHA